MKAERILTRVPELSDWHGVSKYVWSRAMETGLSFQLLVRAPSRFVQQEAETERIDDQLVMCLPEERFIVSESQQDQQVRYLPFLSHKKNH